MKKFLAIMLAVVMVLCLAACKNDNKADNTEAPKATDAATEAPEATKAPEATEAPAEEKAMTYAEYAAADIDAKVIIETYVQATQGWWDNKITAYTQDKDGGYFIYEMACTEDQAKLLVPGTKIRVTGYKAEWAGEVEVATGSTFEIIEGDTYIAEPVDVTALFGTDDLIKNQNQRIAVKGLKVAAKKAADGSDVAFLYKWDGSGAEGDDLYFDVELNGKVYTFTVESYLCGKDTDVYKAVQALKVGDMIDVEGFLYWYEGVQPHVTSVKTAA